MDSKNLIKADNGQDLYDYWFTQYQIDYTKEYLKSRLEVKLTEAITCNNIVNKMLIPSFIKDIMFEKLEISVVHCIVLSKLLKIDITEFTTKINKKIKTKLAHRIK